MIFSFETEYAKKYGVEEAILLQNFIFWINKNKANKVHFYKGRYWTYNSKKAMLELFPFWSESQIKRIINSLINQGVLITGNFNKSPYDKTTWYSLEISIGRFQPIDETELTNREDETNQPIPDNKPDSKPYNDTASPSSVDASDLNNHPVVVTPEEFAKAEEEVKAFEKMRAERDMFTLGYVRDFSKPDEKPTPKKKTKKDKSYSYIGQVIKLTDEDYKKWKELYSNIDLFKNLNEIDDWLAKNNADKNWYFRVQKNLQKRNEAANG